MNPTRVEFQNEYPIETCLDHVNCRWDANFISFIIENKIADHYFVGLSVHPKNETHDSNLTAESQLNIDIRRLYSIYW